MRKYKDFLDQISKVSAKEHEENKENENFKISNKKIIVEETLKEIEFQ